MVASTFRGRSIGRTTDFGSVNRGSIPLPGAPGRQDSDAESCRRSCSPPAKARGCGRAAEAAPPDLRAGDGPARHLRPRAGPPRAHGARGRPRRRAGHQEGPGAGAARGPTSSSSSSRRRAAPATPPPTACRPSRATTSTTSRPWSCSRVTPRCCVPRPSTSSSPSTSPTATPPPCSPACSTTRPATDGSSAAARRPGRCASSSRATPAPTSSPCRRWRRASTRSVGRCSARPCVTCRPTTRRASSTSPTSSACSAGWAIGSVRPGAGRRDPGRQRPLAARPRRARAALPHQPGVAAQRRHHARPAADVHRRHGARRPRRHAVPRHDPAGQHRHRRRLRDRARHPARRLRGRPTAASSSTPSASTPRSATAPGSARTPICRRGRLVAAGHRHRRLLHCTYGLSRARGATWRRSPPRSWRSTRGARTRSSPGGGRTPRHRARPPQHRRVRQRRDPAPLRRERPGQRRLHHPEPLRRRRALDQRLDHGAADHDRRRLSGVGQADHRGVPLLRLRPPGSQGRGPRADLGPSRRRHVQGGRRQADDLDRPPRRPDPGLLRRTRRSPHRAAGARGVRPPARSARHWSSCPRTPAG